MIEEIYKHLLSLDDFNDLSPHDIDIESLQTLEHSEVYRIRVDSPRSNLILKKAGPSDVAGLAEDLSGSHQPASSPVPTRVQCRYFVEALATLHGQTGSRSTVQSTWTKIAGDLPASTIEQRLSFFQLALGSFIAMIRDRVDHEVASFLTGLSDLEEQIQRLTPQDERYRLGVLYSFTSPIVWWWSGVPDAQWWPALGNSLDAARDLGFMN